MKVPNTEEISSHAYFKYMQGSEECNQGIRNRIDGFKEGAEWMEEQLEPLITELGMFKARSHKWISVEEYLPEKHQRVTILEFTLGLTEPNVLQGSWEGGNRWRLYGGQDAEKVTHWMPLPEPPKQD